MTLRVRILESIRDVPQAAWDALHGENDSPFVEWAWLEALEATKCVAPNKGWAPSHLVVERDGLLVAAAPAYIKGHSEGEFVYDWSWAGVAQKLGVDYYPKLILAVPFTPATGSRLLRAPGEDLAEVARLIGGAARVAAEQANLSGVHVLFPHEAECRALCDELGFAERVAAQFHWHNDGYTTFDDFLGRFQSKRRNALRREYSQVDRDKMTVETLRGDQITQDLVAPMYDFYASTVDKFYYGRRYLSKAFFERVVERFRHRLEWVVAREADGRLVAGAFNAHRGKALYGRYWGAIEERPFLHFNVCYYHSIAQSIARGDQVFEPGAGGEHKLARGFDPTLTYSAHWIADKRLDHVLREYLSREGPAVREGVAEEAAQSPIRRKAP